MPIAGNTHFWEADNLAALVGRLLAKPADCCQVGCFVAGLVLKLDGCRSYHIEFSIWKHCSAKALF